MKTNLLKLTALLLVIAGGASCQDENPQEKKLTPVTIGKGTLPDTGIAALAKQNITLTNKAAWDNLMATMNTNANVSDDFSETDIDFNAWQVMAVFDEIHANGGWTIDITDVKEHADKIVVSYTNLATGDASSAPTQPYHIVKIPISVKHTFYENEVQELPFTEYSLEGTSCQWTNLSYDNKALIINSYNELASYITCTEDDCPAIDFSKHTLILVSGTSEYNIYGIPKKLWQFPAKYVLDIETSFSAWYDRQWELAIVTEKIKESSTVVINIDKGHIIGKWKLVEVKKTMPPEESYDYSQYDLIYEFKTNGVLTVSGEIEDVVNYGFSIGEYSYSPNTYNSMIIDRYRPYLYLYLCILSSKNLLLYSIELMDGYDYYFFIRIN